jgi:hypothetical protein
MSQQQHSVWGNCEICERCHRTRSRLGDTDLIQVDRMQFIQYNVLISDILPVTRLPVQCDVTVTRDDSISGVTPPK